jgi:hypothetical protein
MSMLRKIFQHVPSFNFWTGFRRIRKNLSEKKNMHFLISCRRRTIRTASKWTVTTFGGFPSRRAAEFLLKEFNMIMPTVKDRGRSFLSTAFPLVINIEMTY